MHRIKLNDRMTFPNVLNLNKFVDESDKVRLWVWVFWSGLQHCVLYALLQPYRELSEEDLETLYKDFVVEKYENRPT